MQRLSPQLCETEKCRREFVRSCEHMHVLMIMIMTANTRACAHACVCTAYRDDPSSSRCTVQFKTVLRCFIDVFFKLAVEKLWSLLYVWYPAQAVTVHAWLRGAQHLCCDGTMRL